MVLFQYDEKILESFPQTVGGIIIGSGLQNSVTSDALREIYQQRQTKIREKIGDTPLSAIVALSAWRRVFSSFGVSPTKYRSAPESLLRRLTKKGTIPFINTLVDIGNLISITYTMPVAIMDIADMRGGLRVHFADGTERYTELNSDDIIHPEPGEVVFTDETGLVFARRWCWRQSAESAAHENTQDVIITIEAQHENGQADVEKSIAEILPLLKEFAGGTYQSHILDVNQ